MSRYIDQDSAMKLVQSGAAHYKDGLPTKPSFSVEQAIGELTSAINSLAQAYAETRIRHDQMFSRIDNMTTTFNKPKEITERKPDPIVPIVVKPDKWDFIVERDLNGRMRKINAVTLNTSKIKPDKWDFIIERDPNGIMRKINAVKSKK